MSLPECANGKLIEVPNLGRRNSRDCQASTLPALPEGSRLNVSRGTEVCASRFEQLTDTGWIRDASIT